jgi:hypothetical protein
MLHMTHSIFRVDSFEVQAPFVLDIKFDDGTEQIVDFHPVLAGELFSPLKDISVFNRVRIDPAVHTLVWPNGADFDPATLHDWPTHQEALAELAKQWDLNPI